MRFKENIKVWELGNDYVIIDESEENVNFSDVYRLNATSLMLFKCFEDKEFGEADMVAVLAGRFAGIDEAVLKNDVACFILQMKENGFVEE